MRKLWPLSLLLLTSLSVVHAQTPAADSLLNIIRENKQDVQQGKALNALATEYTRTDMNKAKNYLFRSIELSKKLGNEGLLSYAYSQMVTVQQNTGHTDSAAWYLQRLQHLAATSTAFDVTSNFHAAAGLFYKKQGNYKEALPHMIAALDAVDPTHNKNPSPAIKTSKAGQNLNIGNTYMLLGQYKNALSYHLKALQLFDEVANQRGQSFCYQSIGNDFMLLNQYQPALHYTLQSITLKKQLNDQRGVGTSTGNLAEIYMRQGQYDQALQYYTETLRIFHEMKLTADEAKADLEIGKTYRLKKDPTNAALYYQNARQLAEPMKDSTLLANVSSESVALESNIQQQNNAEKKLMSSLHRSLETGDKALEMQSYQYLADHYSGTGQYDKALTYTNKLHHVNDSLQSRELELQISRMEKQYNLDKKEAEIALLKKDQQLNKLTVQRQKNLQTAGIIVLLLLISIGFLIINRYRVLNRARQIIELERMRNGIARDLHDDIGSMLTSINILSKLTLEQVEGPPLIRSNLQKIKDRSTAIMESMGDIVWAINPHNDTVEKMIYRMREFAAEILDPLNIPYKFTQSGDLTAITLDVKKRKDFYLLFKEAINNAAKYSRCSQLNIELKQYQQTIGLEVSDNGDGFNTATARQGNGLQNIQARARSMQGKVQILSTIGKGTQIRLEVPLTSKTV